VILISPIGYSPSGEVFNLVAEDLAKEVACALSAEKLILLTEEPCLQPNTETIIPHMTTQEADQFLMKNPSINPRIIRAIEVASQSCQQGVARVHLIDRHQDGAILRELFTRDGFGTLISSTPFEVLRDATLNDIGGIFELITPLENQGKLVKRSPEKLEMEIDNYRVIERDGLIIACAACHLLKPANLSMMSCLAVHKDYQHQARGQRLFNDMLEKIKRQQIQTLFALSTQTTHWFLERGFQLADVSFLPPSLQPYYDAARNAKVLFKEI
jgi:amino-acid N-acetyltransferase